MLISNSLTRLVLTKLWPRMELKLMAGMLDLTILSQEGPALIGFRAIIVVMVALNVARKVTIPVNAHRMVVSKIKVVVRLVSNVVKRAIFQENVPTLVEPEFKVAGVTMAGVSKAGVKAREWVVVLESSSASMISPRRKVRLCNLRVKGRA